MARRRIGQESFGFGVERQRAGCLDDLSCVIDWSEIDRLLGDVYASAKGEAGWPGEEVTESPLVPAAA